MAEHDNDGNTGEFMDRVLDLNRVLDVGRLLLSVLTPEELAELSAVLLPSDPSCEKDPNQEELSWRKGTVTNT